MNPKANMHMLRTLQSVRTAYPNPPMLEAAVPSPNTLPGEEPIALLKAGAWPNEAVEPNAGELPKAGGLPNTGALPKPPTKKTVTYCVIVKV